MWKSIETLTKEDGLVLGFCGYNSVKEPVYFIGSQYDKRLAPNAIIDRQQGYWKVVKLWMPITPPKAIKEGE